MFMTLQVYKGCSLTWMNIIHQYDDQNQFALDTSVLNVAAKNDVV